MKLTKKAYKAQKRQIVEKGCTNIGYSWALREAIDFDETVAAMHELSDENLLPKDYFEREDMVLTTVIRQMNFKRFKEVSVYFFNHVDVARTFCGYSG